MGAPPTSKGFVKRAHTTPMLSLDNLFNEEDVGMFLARLKEAGATAVHLEPKIDGLSLSLTYVDGVLAHAVTRGDGQQGDDVTTQARLIAGIPGRLSKTLGLSYNAFDGSVIEIRGEVCITYPDFAQVNAEREAAGDEPFANPRNAAVGGLKSLELEQVRQRRMSFFAYHFIPRVAGAIMCHPTTAPGVLSQLIHWGFAVPWDDLHSLELHKDSGYASTIEKIMDVLARHGEQRARKKWDLPTDGMVLKCHELSVRERLGYGPTSPRWAAAFKFPPTQARTRLLAIDIQVGRTGALTPVARLEPVHLDGTTVSNATLHNFKEIERKDIRVGDVVVLEKSGDIIPYIVEVDKGARVPYDMTDKPSTPYVPPAHCPSCAYPVTPDEDVVVLRCRNPRCRAQVQARLEYFVGKSGMDIQQIGPALIQDLINARLVSSPAWCGRSRRCWACVVQWFTKKGRIFVNHIMLASANSLLCFSYGGYFPCRHGRQNIPTRRRLID